MWWSPIHQTCPVCKWKMHRRCRAEAMCYKCVKLAVKLRQRLWSRGSPQPPFGRGRRSGLYGKLATEIIAGNKLDFSLSTSSSIFLIFASTASHDFPFLECMPPLYKYKDTSVHMPSLHCVHKLNNSSVYKQPNCVTQSHTVGGRANVNGVMFLSPHG